MRGDKHKKRVQQFLREHPEYRKREYLHKAVEVMTGVSVQKQLEVKNVLRRLQDEVPVDHKGKALEESFRDEVLGMKSIGEFVRDGVRYRVPNTGSNQ